MVQISILYAERIDEKHAIAQALKQHLESHNDEGKDIDNDSKFYAIAEELDSN